MAVGLGAQPTQCLLLSCAGSDHWHLRRVAATCLREILHRFNDPVYSLQARVCRQLLAALLNTSKALTTHYGAIHGLAALGPQVARALLLPVAARYHGMLVPVLAQVRSWKAWACCVFGWLTGARLVHAARLVHMIGICECWFWLPWRLTRISYVEALVSVLDPGPGPGIVFSDLLARM